MTGRKTHLGPEKLEEFRDLLLEKRKELTGDVEALRREGREESRDSSARLSDVPTHPADEGTDTFEQRISRELLEDERDRLWEVDEALKRIDDGTYGVCAECGEPIEERRLHAKPWARLCLKHAEQGGAG